MKVSIDKSPILKKLESIGLAQQEDRKSPEDEMNRIVKRTENFEGDDVEYYKNLYTSDEMKNLEVTGTGYGTLKPTKDEPAVK